MIPKANRMEQKMAERCRRKIGGWREPALAFTLHSIHQWKDSLDRPKALLPIQFRTRKNLAETTLFMQLSPSLISFPSFHLHSGLSESAAQ